MRKLLSRFVSVVDAVSEKVKFVGFIMLAMTLIVVYEVIMRYVFVNPTIWAWEVNEQLLCTLIVMAGGYTLLHRAHIRVDLIYSRWTDKRKAIVDLVTSFLPLLFCGALLWQVVKLAWKSAATLERASTYFGPPVYPLNVIIVIGVFLFLLQVVADVIRSFLVATAKG